MWKAICNIAAAPVRCEPSHRAEMTSQLLFGETMMVFEEKDEWLNIRSAYDEYEGWITNHLAEPFDHQQATEERFITTGLVNPLMIDEELINIPMGCFLPGLNEETGKLWKENAVYHGSYRTSLDPVDKDLLTRYAMPWLNAPYLWGGKTFLGVDCSGFVQTVYRIGGIKIPRDAWQQAETGTTVFSLEECKQGDLAFFNNDKGKITHVGMMLNEKEIIHASGKVRIDDVDETGIINRSHGKRTHHLHSLKRFL